MIPNPMPPHTFCTTCHRVIYVRDVDAAGNCPDCAAPPVVAFPSRKTSRDE